MLVILHKNKLKKRTLKIDNKNSNKGEVLSNPSLYFMI